MEEIYPTIGQDIRDICKEMYFKLIDEGTPITALANGVRIIMFKEDKVQVPEYDGPR